MQFLDGAKRETQAFGQGFEVSVARCRGVRRVFGGVDDDVGATSGGECSAEGRVVAGDDGAHADGLEHENDGKADGSAADHDRDVLLGDL